MKRLIVCAALLACCLAAPALANDAALGEQLVRDLFADIRAGRIEAVAARIAPGFQSVHQDGVRLRQDEILLLEQLSLGEFELGDFTITRSGPVLVVSYSVSVDEAIEATRLARTKAYRLSVFVDTPQGWQWTGHANLRPLSR